MRVGLTGGIACGKSVVRRRLSECDVPTLDADEVVHGLLASGTDVSREIESAFGAEVVAADGSVDRKRLGARAFSDERARERLNAIVHPRVFSAIESFFEKMAREKKSIAVVDAALMIETGSFRHYDCIVVVFCRPALQLRRLMERDGLTREEAERRIRAQMPIDEKCRFADFLVDTSGTLEGTLAQTDRLLDELRARV